MVSELIVIFFYIFIEDIYMFVKKILYVFFIGIKQKFICCVCEVDINCMEQYVVLFLYLQIQMY